MRCNNSCEMPNAPRDASYQRQNFCSITCSHRVIYIYCIWKKKYINLNDKARNIWQKFYILKIDIARHSKNFNNNTEGFIVWQVMPWNYNTHKSKIVNIWQKFNTLLQSCMNVQRIKYFTEQLIPSLACNQREIYFL